MDNCGVGFEDTVRIHLREHLLTFQDDEVAFRYADSMNWRRPMWANDFPHPDASRPNSKALIEKLAATLNAERRAILCGNAAALYGCNLDRLTALAA